jgi:uncharacterized protein YgbK (DUF1537 family)
VRLGVVADDITGAGDIGGMTAKAGYLTHLYPHDAFAGSPAEICVLDTDSRLDEPQAAYHKVYAATQALREAGCRQFFNKTCSVFRGNIGAEFDAMLDALGETFAVVVLGFPKNGRTTVNGIHYVHGERLEHSPFRHDPVHPTTRSNLVDILQSQTARPVGLVTHQVIAQGVSALRETVAAARVRGGYLILDVPHDEALVTIASAVADLPVLCGSSALAEVLPRHWPPPAQAAPPSLPRTRSGVLVVAGSLTPQTVAQLAHLEARGIPLLELDTRRLFDSAAAQGEFRRLTHEARRVLGQGGCVAVHSAGDPEAVRATQALGMARGLSRAAASRAVSQALAEVAAACRDQVGLTRLVVAGGDTSATVCRRLGLTGLRVYREIRPGLPSCLTLGEVPMLLVLKSGSFGAPEFLEEAIDHVQEAGS